MKNSIIQSVHGRKGSHLHEYVQKCQEHRSVLTDTLRFRIGDTMKEVRDLIMAAIRDSSQSPLDTKYLADTLVWFNGLSSAGFAGLFPRGAETGDTSRRDHIVDSFDRAYELNHKVGEDLCTRIRVGLLSQMRKVLGDRPSLMPKELAGFAEFRGSDSLADIRRLAMENCGAAAVAANDGEQRERLSDLKLGLFVVSTFDEIAKITGLDRRHKA